VRKDGGVALQPDLTVVTKNRDEVLKVLAKYTLQAGSATTAREQVAASEAVRSGAAATIAVRIPVAEYTAFRRRLEAMGTVTASAGSGAAAKAEAKKALEPQSDRGFIVLRIAVLTDPDNS
jgi:hypothetical protein